MNYLCIESCCRTDCSEGDWRKGPAHNQTQGLLSFTEFKLCELLIPFTILCLPSPYLLVTCLRYVSIRAQTTYRMFAGQLLSLIVLPRLRHSLRQSAVHSVGTATSVSAVVLFSSWCTELYSALSTLECAAARSIVCLRTGDQM